MSKRKQPIGCSKHDIDSYIGCAGCDAVQAKWKAEQAPVSNDLETKLRAHLNNCSRIGDWSLASDIARIALEHAAEMADSFGAGVPPRGTLTRILQDACNHGAREGCKLIAQSIRATARALGSRT